tara:strand:+ start:8037 stop:9443 length:1407 start_codon:yes stop_codon:yes gene_type:complete
VKSILDYKNPQDLSGSLDFALVIYANACNGFDFDLFEHPTIELPSATTSPTRYSCYIEYLQFIVDNYWKLPEIVMCVSGFTLRELSGTANKTPNHSLRDSIVRELGRIKFVSETVIFGKISRLHRNSGFEAWCDRFGIESIPTKFSKVPVYAINRLSVLRNPPDYYERLLNWATKNPHQLEYLMFAWVHIFDTGAKIPSMYVEQKTLIEPNIASPKKPQSSMYNDTLKLPQKIEAVTVCVNYAESLREVVSNKLHFDRWVIVTTSYDTETQSVCEECGLECVISDRIHEGGEYIFTHYGLKTPNGLKPGEKVLLERAPLAKGKAINDGLDVCDKTDWLIHIDADIKLPLNFGKELRMTELDVKSLYGMSQRIDLDANCDGSWVNGLGRGEDGAIGWFQLFHSVSLDEVFDGVYPEESADTWWDDISFARGFGHNQKCLHTQTAMSVRPNSNPIQMQSWYAGIEKKKLD